MKINLLRGNSTSGGIGEESLTQCSITTSDDEHEYAGGNPAIIQRINGHYVPGPNTTTAWTEENKPPYYDIVWIMRVK